MKILVGFDPVEYPEIRIFQNLGECTFVRYDNNFLNSNIHKFDVLVPNLFVKLTEDLLVKGSRLSVIATPSTGTDHIDVVSATKMGKAVLTLSDDRDFIRGITSTAELAFMLMLSAMRKFRFLQERIYGDQTWINYDVRGRELKNKTVGIIGFGRLGQMMAKYCLAFGMRVLAFDTNKNLTASGVEFVSLDNLLADSDVISAHPKLNESSRHLVDDAAIDKMKVGVILVNTSRGEVFDSDAVIRGLDSGIIGAIAVDVCCGEFEGGRLPTDPLLQRSFVDNKVIITPHVGGATLDAHELVFEHTCNSLRRYLCVH